MVDLETTTDAGIVFHNNSQLKVQAQVFVAEMVISTAVAAPGETLLLPVTTTPFDIYLKNGATGWELARKLNSNAKTVTLTARQGRYVVT